MGRNYIHRTFYDLGSRCLMCFLLLYPHFLQDSGPFVYGISKVTFKVSLGMCDLVSVGMWMYSMLVYFYTAVIREPAIYHNMDTSVPTYVHMTNQVTVHDVNRRLVYVTVSVCVCMLTHSGSVRVFSGRNLRMSVCVCVFLIVSDDVYERAALFLISVIKLQQGSV